MKIKQNESVTIAMGSVFDTRTARGASDLKFINPDLIPGVILISHSIYFSEVG